ncbi:MAG: DUF1501 domain-containing protein [Planctomycetota bacterium]|nr:MAG: DUF1501 domain-containing protein [Planctomycetota bacterium]REJ88895.1 MAG: DUF1501 domain-containing protein [Planctomycetota bacterium]
MHINRRQMLQRSGMGLATIGLAGVLAEDGLLAEESTLSAASTHDHGATRARRQEDPMAARPPHFPAQARQVIHVFLNGGLSHVDTFDPKPELSRLDGQPLPGDLPKTEFRAGALMGSPFKFAKYGQSGIEVSELFPKVGGVIDEFCVIRSMHADVPIHERSLMLMNCGTDVQFTPSMGSWLTYGLGSENQNLPGFVVLCPGKGDVVKGAENWRSAFLPPIYQGTLVGTSDRRLEKLLANIRNPRIAGEPQRRQVDLLQALNLRHLAERGEDEQLEARIQSYEMAYRMQAAAADAFDISREPKHMHDMYGESVQCKQLLMARRLVERGVRFVQVWHGSGQPWDNHQRINRALPRLAGECDQGIAALIFDLRQRGMLDETLVLVTGEFGRTPTVQLFDDQGRNGRDHNSYGFTSLIAGGGVRGGMVYGATDDFGFHSVENKVHVHDLHATMLHQLGLDHKRLTYRYSGRDFRFTDIHGHVVEELIG